MAGRTALPAAVLYAGSYSGQIVVVPEIGHFGAFLVVMSCGVLRNGRSRSCCPEKRGTPLSRRGGSSAFRPLPAVSLESTVSSQPRCLVCSHAKDVEVLSMAM